MRYVDGHEAKAGDLIRIDTRYRGKVLACIDTGDYLPGHESWSYLGAGIIVDTDFGGLVHYLQEHVLDEDLILLERVAAP